MAGNFIRKFFQISIMLLVLLIPLTYAFPTSDDNMIHNDNYETILPDDHVPAESMQYQNFEQFFNSEVEDSDMSEMQMDESRGATQVRAPQPLSAKEIHLRQHLEDFDVQREKRNQRSLTKGSTRPREHVHDWEQFDYDAHVPSYY